MDVLHLWNDDLIYPANLGEIDWMDNVWMIRVTLENWIPVIQDGALLWLLHITFVYNSILLFTSVPNTTKIYLWQQKLQLPFLQNCCPLDPSTPGRKITTAKLFKSCSLSRAANTRFQLSCHFSFSFHFFLFWEM